MLTPGERLLDIGCGWGGLARHAAEHYAVEVVGISVSEEQRKLASINCRGLPVEIKLMDYRDLTGEFDKVVSVGMFEHVGPKNYAHFFRTIERVLTDRGLILLHTIGNYRSYNAIDPWMNKYIFPNGHLPSAREITSAIEPDFIIRDWHNFGFDYDRTLMSWWNNFDSAWPELKRRYDERFYRPHVEILSALLRRSVPVRARPVVADRVVASRHQTRISIDSLGRHLAAAMLSVINENHVVSNQKIGITPSSIL